MKELNGKVAVITGAGSGFGREFARLGAREGMKLVLADVQREALEAVVAELKGADTPVVYLPWVERKASGTTYTAAHPDLMMFGRVVSDVSIEVVQGEEWVEAGAANGEVVRTSSVRIEEEV